MERGKSIRKGYGGLVGRDAELARRGLEGATDNKMAEWLRLRRPKGWFIESIIKPRLTFTITDYMTQEQTEVYGWQEENGYLCLPRVFGYDLLANTTKDRVQDKTVIGAAAGFTFDELKASAWKHRGAQVKVRDSFLRELHEGIGSGCHGGILCAPPGFGKTVVGADIAAKLGRKPVVLVHKEFLYNQWVETFQSFCGLAREEIGLIQQDRCEWGSDVKVAVAMIQSLVERGREAYPEQLFREFGTVIFDECVAGDTRVITEQGSMPIASCEKASLVLSFNETRSTFEYRRILAWLPRGKRQTLKIQFTDGTSVICTPEHRVLTVDGWREARELKPKMFLLSAPADVEKHCSNLMRGVGSEGGYRDTREIYGEGLTGWKGLKYGKQLPHIVNAGAASVLNWIGNIIKRSGVKRLTGLNINWGITGEVSLSAKILRALKGLFSVPCWEMGVLIDPTGQRGGLDYCFSTVSDRRLGYFIRQRNYHALLSKLNRWKMGGGEGRLYGRYLQRNQFWKKFGKFAEKQGKSGLLNNGSIIYQMKEWLGGLWTMAPLKMGKLLYILRGIQNKKISLLGRGWRKKALFPKSAGREGIGILACEPECPPFSSEKSPFLSSPKCGIKQIQSITPAGCRDVYDLTVEGNHNFVGNGVVAHNCHRYGAAEWQKVITMFPSTYRVGVTATPRRKDGMMPLLYAHIGPILAESGVRYLAPKIRYIRFNGPYTLRKYGSKNKNTGLWEYNKKRRSALITDIAKRESRNRMIAGELVNAAKAGRSVLVLTERREQVGILEQMLAAHDWLKVGRYIGGESATMMEFSENEAHIVLATYQMAKEGLDIPRLDTLLMATPAVDVEQPVGRILRDYAEKKEPVVTDILDTELPVCEDWQLNRKLIYAKLQKTGQGT